MTMASTWTNTMVKQPDDSTTVWCVRIPYFDTPFQALFTRVPDIFTFTDDIGNTVEIPMYEVFKWRDL